MNNWNKIYQSNLKIMGFCLWLSLISGFKGYSQNGRSGAVRLAVAGITHGHVAWILGRKEKTDISLVGIYEPDKDLARRYAQKYNLSQDLFFSNLGKML